MNELISQLSSYKFFNYLFPGVIFVIILKQLNICDLTQTDLFIGFFVYYFIGLLISRFGSLVLGPLLKLVKFVEFEPYTAFLEASKKDPKIDILSESHSTYRTIAGMFILLLIMIGYKKIIDIFPVVSNYSLLILIISFSIIFIFAYRKQTKFIVGRVQSANKK